VADREEIFAFPCRFPIKAIGPQSPDFKNHVIEICETHVGAIVAEDVKMQPSSNGRFVSVTVTFTAESRTQLDALYQALTDSKKIKVVF
jgi:putative lipoic acid-binding regulatory protein